MIEIPSIKSSIRELSSIQIDDNTQLDTMNIEGLKHPLETSIRDEVTVLESKIAGKPLKSLHSKTVNESDTMLNIEN